MNKWYIIFVVSLYATLKITEASFGESDLYVIIISSGLAFAIFLGVAMRRKVSLRNALLLVVPVLIIAGMLSLRYFMKVAISDWMIWTTGLISGIICLGLFRLEVRERL